MGTSKKLSIPEIIRRKVTYWQNAIYLQHWDIVIEIVPRNKQTDFYACISPDAMKRQALMQIHNPESWDIEDPFCPTLDHVIVHELMHVHFLPPDVSKDSREWAEYEASIETVSKSIVELNGHKIRANGKRPF